MMMNGKRLSGWKVSRAFLYLLILFLLSNCASVLVETLNQLELTQIKVEGEKMYLMGDFNSKSYDQVKTAIESNTNVTTIVLTANSGSLDDETTFRLGRFFRERGLHTHLLNQSVIASGAVDLFLSGVSRTIEHGATLGVHSWSNGLKQGKDFPKDHDAHTLNATYIEDMLGQDDFYWFTIYAAPADSIYWMEEDEIQRFNIITTPFLSPSKDPTPYGDRFLTEREAILEG